MPTPTLTFPNQIQVILDALLSSQKHYSVLTTWDIVDAGFFIRFIYLSHFYKIKLIKVVQERLMNRCLNKYADDNFFKNDTSTMLKTCFEVIIHSMKDIGRIRTVIIFNHLYLEIMSKNIFFVLFHFREMLRHPANALTQRQMRLVVGELCGLDAYIHTILDYTENEYKIETAVAKVELRLANFNRLRLDTIQVILDIFLSRFQERVRTEFTSLFAVKPIRERLQEVLNDFRDDQDLAPEFTAMFQEKQISIFMQEYLTYLLTKSNEVLKTEFKQIELDARWFLEHFHKVSVEGETTFFECFKTFLESEKRSECWDCISLMAGLMSPPLKRTEVLAVIAKKTFNPKSDFQEKLKRQVNEHFRLAGIFQTKRAVHASTFKKFHVMGLQILFIVRCKRTTASIGANTGYENVKRTLQNLDERQKLQTIEGLRGMKVRAVFFSKSQIKNTYQGLPLTVL